MTSHSSSLTENEASWWRQAVVYEVYPRSFADSNGDGLGDLPGVTSRVPYLAALGVDAIWLSPFYPSALADGGYDVDDYRDVDPRLGTLADFDTLTGALHAAGMRIIVDIVANHSSNAHAWFTDALAAGPGSRERDRYIFRDGRGDNGVLPPNDWPSHFGPTAWTRVADAEGTPGQWYLHLFAPEQPDLNWDDPDVNGDFLTTLRFWADRGVDGFRIDAAHLLKKDLSEPYRPVPTIGIVEDYPDDGSHPLVDRDDVHDVYRAWRGVFDNYTPPRAAVAETAVSAVRRARYAAPEGLGQAFNFDLVVTPWSAREFATTIATGLDVARDSGSTSTWTLSSHDGVRYASRLGLPDDTDLNQWLLSDGTDPVVDADQGLRRARAAALLMLALPGSTYLFQGEELGLPEVADLPPDALQDPMWLRDGGARKGRDGCRVPIPWTTHGPSFGFGSAGSHLPMPAWFAQFAVERQDATPGSTLELYRTALRLRRRMLTTETLTWRQGPDDVLWFSRDNGWNSFTNFGREPVALPPGQVLLSSERFAGQAVPGEATVWFRG